MLAHACLRIKLKLNLPSVGKHTCAHFVGLKIQLAVVIWQGVEYDEIQINFLLAVAVLGA